MIIYCSLLIYAILRVELKAAVSLDKEWECAWVSNIVRQADADGNETKNAKKRVKKHRKNFSLPVLSIFMGICVSVTLRFRGDDKWKLFVLCVIAASFLMATVTDVVICNVYKFVWWIAWTAGLSLLLRIIFSEVRNTMPTCSSCLELGERLRKLHLEELLIFCLFQEVFFERFYGKADCHAFCAGALLLCSFGGDMKEYLLIMAAAFGLLFVAQAFKRNINSKGNLKRPVAFMPYITVSLWGMLTIKSIFS